MPHGRLRTKKAIEFARTQRKEANEFARTVWRWLRNRRCLNQKFRREVPIGPYTADFCCISLMLVIEIDGEPHQTEEGIKRDAARDEYLKSFGYKVLRIPGFEVVREDGVAHRKIWEFVRAAIGEVEDRAGDGDEVQDEVRDGDEVKDEVKDGERLAGADPSPPTPLP